MASQTHSLINLVLYFAINLGLSTCNKLVLLKLPCPWMLTAMHAACTSVGCAILWKLRYFEMTNLTVRANATLVLFSILFTVNIAISNVSLSLVSLPFHQVVRSTGPLFIVLIYRVLYARTYASSVYLSLVAMTVGIGFTTFGDYYFTTIGFCWTIFGVVLAATKTIVTNMLMTGDLKLHPFEILLRTCPLAALQSLFCAVLAGEHIQIDPGLASAAAESSSYTLYLVMSNAFLAFLQNASSFYTNKTLGALTLMVCANLKQSFTIGLAIAVFDVHVGVLNAVGMVITVIGSAWYSWLKVRHFEYSNMKTSTEVASGLPKNAVVFNGLQHHYASKI